MSNKLILLALLAIVGIANAEYARGMFYFQSGATVIAIGAIMWIPPTNATGDITAERWIFGNVSYTGTMPDYQAFVFDLENKTITCELNTGNCFKNETGVKRGWHSIRVYLRNSAGENWSEQRYIYMNVSKEQAGSIIIMDESEAGIENNIYGLLLLLVFIAGTMMYGFTRKQQESDNESAEGGG
jgi:hypothetical protein